MGLFYFRKPRRFELPARPGRDDAPRDEAGRRKFDFRRAEVRAKLKSRGRSFVWLAVALGSALYFMWMLSRFVSEPRWFE